MLLAYFRESREGNFDTPDSWSGNFLVREPFQRTPSGTQGIPPLSNMIDTLARLLCRALLISFAMSATRRQDQPTCDSAETKTRNIDLAKHRHRSKENRRLSLLRRVFCSLVDQWCLLRQSFVRVEIIWIDSLPLLNYSQGLARSVPSTRFPSSKLRAEQTSRGTFAK